MKSGKTVLRMDMGLMVAIVLVTILVLSVLPFLSAVLSGMTVSEALTVLGQNGYVAYANPAGTLITDDINPRIDSTFDVGASGNEYAEGWFDKLYAGGSEVVRTATIVVAASNASAWNIAQSDLQCDGTDDHVQIQIAIDYVNTLGGGTVELTEGRFDVETLEIKPDVWLRGQGWATIISLENNVNGDVITSVIVDTESRTKITDLLIDGNKANQASGNGIDYSTLGGIYIEGVKVFSSKDDGIYADDGANNYANHPTIENTVVSQSGGNGIFTGSIWAFRFNNVYSVNNAGDGFQQVGGGEGSIDQCFSDLNTGKGIYWWNVDRSTITDCPYIGDNGQSGIELINSSADNVISGNLIVNNGSVGNPYGIMISGTGANNLITSNRMFNYSGIEQDYGVFIQANGNNTTVQNNDVTGNNILGMSIASSDNLIRNNKGWVTENWGTGTITATSIAIAHGLATTPTHVTFTGMEDPTNPVESMWWTANTTHTVYNVETDPGAGDWDFSWGNFVR